MNFNPSDKRTVFPLLIDKCINLNLPSKFIPYLENHNIENILSEITKELILEKPKDILKTIKNILLKKELLKCDIQKIIIISPPQIDNLLLLCCLTHYINCIPITMTHVLEKICEEENKKKFDINSMEKEIFKNENIINYLEEKNSSNIQSFVDENYKSDISLNIKFSIPDLNIDNIANIENESKKNIKKMQKIMQNLECNKDIIFEKQFIPALKLLINEIENKQKGWIFIDFPKNKEQSLLLFKYNIIPTHVILLITNIKNNLKSQQDYYLQSLEFKQIYSYFIKEININNKNEIQISKEILNIIQTPIKIYNNNIYRVVIIGPKNIGIEIYGKKLNDKFNIINIDMEKSIQLHKIKGYINYNEKLIKRILKDDCVNSGYIITGFPRNIEDLKLIINSDNPPNRIIILKMSEKYYLKLIDSSNDVTNCIQTGEIIIKPLSEFIKYQNLSKEFREYKKEIKKILEEYNDSIIKINADCNTESLYQKILNEILYPSRIIKAPNCFNYLNNCNQDINSQISDDSSIKTIEFCDLRKLKFMDLIPCEQTDEECDIKTILKSEYC